MNILLTGANGFIGRNIAISLSSAGHQVRPVSRSHGVDYCRMLGSEDWKPCLDDIDAVINCVGIIAENRNQRFEILHNQAPCALFKACESLGIRQVVQISALGADKTAFSAYHLSKRAADDTLRSLDLDWFVLRPSLVYGRGGKSADLFMRLAAMPWIPVIGGGQQQLQPIHISDVVATVMQCLVSIKPKQTLDIVGEETIKFSEWLQLMRHAQGLPRARLLHIPFSLAMMFARLGRYINPIVQPDNLQMLRAGYWADSQPIVHFLGRSPLRANSRLFFCDGELKGEVS